ncbi:RloB family protein [Nocardiopsis sp. RSe5-2]|uniref:RloB family protein n=1 Tax=Nocardiopsis endophytica TaxID=3018445 RepID=A0ABT4TXN8_9ACTN|nr:RloB family protein [Nocardiopsis endophytica]MDA2809453.1 RloB family protein [Nocardiopsis endophytica]
MSKRDRRRRRRSSIDDEIPLGPSAASRDRQVRVLYVAVEGAATEPDYLIHLNHTFGDGGDRGDGRRPFQIHPISDRNGLLPKQAVAKAAEKAREGEEAWVLFDKDGADRDGDIREALAAASDVQVDVCLSHPSFDLWLLLHFQPFSGAQSGSSRHVVDKLRAARGAEAFKDYDKRNDKSIKGRRRDALRGREAAAVANARALVNACEHGGCKAGKAQTGQVDRRPSGEPTAKRGRWAARTGHAPECDPVKRDPSTDVWRLLVSLGIV